MGILSELKDKYLKIRTEKFPDCEYAAKGINNFEEGYKNNDTSLEYIGFSEFVQAAFIGKNDYIIDIGGLSDVNRELMYLISKKIEKHPKIWKRYFKV